MSKSETKVNGTNGFSVPPFGFPWGFPRAQEGCEKIKATSVEIAAALRETYASNAQSATEYGLKLIELSQANTATAIDFAADILASRSPVDALSLSATQARKVFETASAQNKELWQLTQRLATETRESIKRQVDKALGQPS
ncbi:hypothetical protein ACVMIH_003750 [Bradyrhizobium sp. USDA 4503]